MRRLALFAALALAAVVLLVRELGAPREVERRGVEGRTPVTGATESGGTLNAPGERPGSGSEIPVSAEEEETVGAARALVGPAGGEPAPALHHGRVVDHGGQPVAGALVLLLDEEEARGAGALGAEAIALGTADGAGRFAIAADVRRRLAAAASAPSFLASGAQAIAPGADVVLRLGRTQPFGGRVLDVETGAPIAGARVRTVDAPIVAGATYFSAQETTADDFGRYSMSAGYLHPQIVQPVQIARPGEAPFEAWLRLEPGVSSGYDLLVPASRDVVLEVVDFETDEPIPGLALEVGALRATTDAAGRAVVRAPVSRHGTPPLAARLELRAPGYVEMILRLTEDHTRVRLARPARIAGRVVDGNGDALPGAVVRARPLVSGRPGAHFRADTATTAAGESGGYALGGLPPGRVQLEASYPGFAPGEFEVETEPGRTVELEVDVAAGGAIRGRVTRAGAPAEAWVTWSTVGGLTSGKVRTDAAGEFLVLDVPEGRIRLQTRPDDGAWTVATAETVQVRPGEAAEVELRLATAVLAGTVRDETGLPREGVPVLAQRTRGERTDAVARTDARGRFEIRLHGANGSGGIWTVTARSVVHETTLRDVPSGTFEIELVLAREGQVRVRVTDAATGRQHPRALRFHWRQGARPLQGHGELTGRGVGPGGAYVLELPAGAVDLAVESADPSYSPVVVPDVAVEAGRVTDVDVALERGTQLAIVVEPAPLPERVELLLLAPAELAAAREKDEPPADPFAGLHEWSRRRLVLRGDEPRGVLHGLAPGTYVVLVEPETLRVEPQRIEVPRAERHAVHLTWSER